MKLHVALGQMDVVLGQPQTNLDTVKTLAATAANQGVDMLVLPELWSTGYDLEHAAQYATPVNQGIFAETAVLAHRHRLHIIGSCLSTIGEGQFGNTAVFHTPTGQLLGVYHKVHLFRLMDEDQYLTAGDHLTVANTPWGIMGLAICYDLRFPEIFRAYALSGAKIIILPAEWPYPRLAHWQTLLRARAIENQLYVIACNRVGTSKNSTFFGHSCIIDPWGEVVAEAGETEELITAEIDLTKVDEIRAKIPVFADRRPQLYQKGIS